jgi:protein-S-isoprenylcysteine O-methyltransferase Ste14
MTTLIAQQNPTWFRGFIQGKTRKTLAWLFVLLLGFAAREYPAWPGIGVCFLGASLRYWASGYLRKDSRPAVGGPYSFVRNPLYLGTYLMAVGVALSLENWVLLGSVTVLFAVIYHYIILDEETKLRKMFKDPYLDYCQIVPRFFPRIWLPFSGENQKVLRRVNPEANHHLFSQELASKNKAYEAYLSFFGLIAFVTGIAYLWKHI